MSEAHYLRELENFMRKIHKNKQHINFLETCLYKDALPNFTLLPQQTINKLKLNIHQIKQYRTNILIDALTNQNSNLIYFSQHYENISLKFQRTNNDFRKILAILHSRIVQSEKENDDRRDYKLKRLINPTNNYNDPNIEVFNYSSQDIPENILSILKRGIFNGVGGYNKKTAVLAKFEYFFTSWKKHAEKKNINFFKINKIRSQIFLEFENI